MTSCDGNEVNRQRLRIVVIIMFHVCMAHCMPEKIHKMSKCENSCLYMWSTVCKIVHMLTVIKLHHKV